MFVRSLFAKCLADREELEVLMATDLPGILIVDDNEDNRYTLQLMLESDGHEHIASAAGGNEAIALIEKEKFSLVLLDLMVNTDFAFGLDNGGRLMYGDGDGATDRTINGNTAVNTNKWVHGCVTRVKSSRAVAM
jgi:Response regulator receiver domain